MPHYILLGDLPRVYPLPGRRPGTTVSLTTLWRWATAGIRGGIRLRTALVGGHRATTKEWVDEFLAALNAPQEEATTRPRRRTPEQRRRASRNAEERLRAAGGPRTSGREEANRAVRNGNGDETAEAEPTESLAEGGR
jgi:hypothetical protein